MTKELSKELNLEPSTKLDKNQAIRLAKYAANYILQKYWANKPFPVNPIEIAREMGIEVKVGEFKDSLADVIGVLISKGDNHQIIYASSEQSQQRIRFTIAHELGHFIHNESIAQLERPYNKIDYRDSNSSKAVDPEEIFANVFAANLLVPKQEIVNVMSPVISRYNIQALAGYFNVSLQVIKNRLTTLGILDSAS